MALSGAFRHPFTPERLMGVVHAVDGATARVTLPKAASLVGNAYGERLALGAIGEFVVIDIGGLAIFGRLLEIEAPQRELVLVKPEDRTDRISASGTVQLLSTLRLDGTYTRGLERHPRVGDQVYSASDEVLEAIVSGVSGADDGTGDVRISLGALAVGDDVQVDVSASKLFGRHLAVLGSTGAGKSWTVARLIEEVAAKGGRLLLVDATGEYHSLGDLARHLSLSSNPTAVISPETAVCLPHFEFAEPDRNAFLRPSAGSQLPKLRAAIRSLRLAHVLGGEHPLVKSGALPKAGRSRADIVGAHREFAHVVDDPHAQFDLTSLPDQISHECIFENDRADETKYGAFSNNDISYCSSLVSRVMDLLQTGVVREVVCPSESRPSLLAETTRWLEEPESPPVLRLSLRDLVFSHYLREITVNTLGRRLLTLAREGHFLEQPLIVVVDEAHQFFGQTIGDEFTSTTMDAFDSIAKEGRKYGLTICMATQRPGDLPTGVLSQVGMLIVHRLADRRDRERVEQGSSEVDYAATKLLPTLVPGEGLLVGADFPVPVPVRVRAPERRPQSQGPDYGTWCARTP